MQAEAFKKWLNNNKPAKEKIIADAISRLKRIENIEGDLDKHFDTDGGKKLLEILTVSNDEPLKENRFKIKGDLYKGMASLKAAFKKYCEFRMDMMKKETKVDSFHEFLIKKKKEESDENDWVERKEKWLHSIDHLYTDIKKWMAPFQKEGLLKITDEKEINIIEEHIGRYQAKRLDLYVGNDVISIIPKGTLIYGFYGRLDMNGPKGEFIILEPKWGNWKIAGRASKLEPRDFTKESFKQIVKEIAD